MKLGLQLGYWGAQPPDNHAELVAAAEDAGFDAVFTAEAWGSDAYTPLAWWGSSTRTAAAGHLGGAAVRAHSDRVRDGGADARPPVAADGTSSGLGVSGPQVVEGWYGQSFPKPLARTREYIDIVRQVLGPGEAGDQRRPALPAAVDRRAHDWIRQAAQADNASAASRHPDSAGRRGGRNMAFAAGIYETAGCPSSTPRGSPEQYPDRMASTRASPSRAPAVTVETFRSARRRTS